jgi:methylated-DNA-[protein]-cysteine S-methyltransferase
MSTRHTVTETGLGPVTVAAQDAAVTGLYFRHHVRRPSPDTFGPAVSPATDARLSAAAGQLGDHRLAYRVGQAVGANPLWIFVPGHRVVGADGSLTGYAGGLKRKQALLGLKEPAQVSAARLL